MAIRLARDIVLGALESEGIYPIAALESRHWVLTFLDLLLIVVARACVSVQHSKVWLCRKRRTPNLKYATHEHQNIYLGYQC